MTFKSCLKSMRLRTLPLSLAGVIAGMSLASDSVRLSFPLVAALLLTTALLQILSNLSNELGDTLHGVDTAERQGIRYSLQDGDMTVDEMKKLIAVVAVLCCVSGLLMTLLSFRALFAIEPLAILALGAAAVWAAMHYTLGKNPYGYKGLGDIFVFVFFGLVSVLGAAYVCSHSFRVEWALPACAIGFWSIGVLNVNNIRDMKTDAVARVTVALKLGLRNARIYQTVLIVFGWLLMLAFSVLTAADSARWLYFLTLPLFVLHLRGVWTKVDRELDPMLPLLVMSSFATSVLFSIPV